MTIELIGVPTNSSGTTDGVARAPAALRAAGLVERLRAVADVIDGGDLLVDEPSTERGADGVIDGANLARTLARLGDRVAAARRRGDRLLLVGGDCPILLGALAGCADADADRRAPGLLFVDGHEDAWPPHASTTGEAADMELGWLLGRGLDQLDPALAARIPRLDAGRVAILGPRDRAELVEAGVEALDDLVPVIDDDAVRRDPSAATIAALARVDPGDGPWWLHVDLDVLSSVALPAVDYEQPGGWTWEQLANVTGPALAAGGAVGVTVTIYNPDLDPDARHAPAVVEAIARLAAGLAASR